MVEVVHTVEHKAPFGVIVLMVVPVDDRQGVGRQAALHVPGLIEGEGLVNELIGVRDDFLCRVRTDEACGLCELFVLCEKVQRLLYEIHGISLLLIGGKQKGVALWQLP